MRRSSDTQNVILLPVVPLAEVEANDEISIERGGPGSGHFGHEGRPGQRGGSQPGEGAGDYRRYNVEGGHAPRGFSEADYGEHEGVMWIWNPSGVQAEQRLGEPGVGGWQGWRKANISLSARPDGYRVVLTHGRTRSAEDARFVSPTLDEARKAGAAWVLTGEKPALPAALRGT